MKNYRTRVIADSKAPPMTAFTLFGISDLVSELATKQYRQVIQSKGTAAQKLRLILKQQADSNKVFKDESIRSLLNDYFYFDGSIKLTPADLAELKKSIVSIDSKGRIETKKDSDTIFADYLSKVTLDFAYQSGGKLIFRGPKYYFIFDSLKVNMQDRSSSINDYIIEDINVKAFVEELSSHYNSIHQHIQLFSTFFLKNLHRDLLENNAEFCAEIKDAISETRLGAARQQIASGKFFIGNENVDQMYLSQWNRTLERLEFFRAIIEHYEKSPTPHIIEHIVDFIARESLLLRHAKVTFGIDIDAIFNKFAKTSPTKSMRKMLLGLLDAKINILAFMQNLAQILYSDHFLNPDFAGSLVFERDTVRNIRATCPGDFKVFKAIQKQLNERDENASLLAELDDHVCFYMDVLMGDNNLSYVKLVGQIPSALPEIVRGKSNAIPNELKDALDLTTAFFRLLEAYLKTHEQRENNLEAKHLKRGKTYTKTGAYLRVKQTALKKLIRLYREENDPLVMIKTAQNSLNAIIARGFQPNKDVLHILSVNYGGALVGLHAKHVFSRTVNRGQVLANTGGLVYSIYDVKNANSFSELSDYPFSKIMKDETVGADLKLKFENENWLLVFDDNTNSGETLDNLRHLAKQSGFYGRIDVFPCRASTNLANYKSSLTDYQKLSMIMNSAVAARRTKVNRSGKRYKELIGTMVGNRLSKLLRPLPAGPDNWPAQVGRPNSAGCGRV